MKTCGLSCETRLLFFLSSHLFRAGRLFSPPFPSSLFRSSAPFPLACVGAPRRTPTPASRPQRVRNSCLHPSPSLLTRGQLVTCGRRCLLFSAFTGEGKSSESFTFNPLYHSFLSPKGEEVKAKNGKQRTHALRARVGLARCTAGGEAKMECS